MNMNKDRYRKINKGLKDNYCSLKKINRLKWNKKKKNRYKKN